MKKTEKRVVKCLLWLMLLAVMLVAQPASASAKPKATGISVAYHTPAQIRKYVKNHKFDMYGQVKMSKQAVTQSPYAYGKVSNASLKDGLKALNTMRYIAGIPANVKLDSKYTQMCQAAAMVNAANQSLSHYPKKPDGMSQSMYDLGYKGASSSNIAWASWSTSLSFSVVRQWMEDGDAYNIDRVGHRRWILNPSMKKTGFGFAKGFSAMYAFDSCFEPTSYYGVAWPAQSMPVEYFGSEYPWSISMGYTIDQTSKVKVTLTRKSDGKTWKFSEKSADGFFNIENGGYGRSGCIIFRPGNVSYKAGDTYQVTITGLKEKVSYEVKFFSL